LKTRTAFRLLGCAIEEIDVKRELHTTLEAPTEARDTTARRTARCSFAPFFALSWRLPMGWAGIVAGLESVKAGERDGGGCLEKVARIFFIGEKLTLQRARYACCLHGDAPPQKASRLGSLSLSACSSACFIFLLSFPRLSIFPSLANSSTVASARTEAVAASPQPLWHKAGAVQESVAAVFAKLEAGIVSGVVQVPFFCCVALSAVRAPER
jgi:hypothetical protein